ncbi:alcohol dehydrogenase catalytic domain-containing protein [Sorangium sp. So ce281]
MQKPSDQLSTSRSRAVRLDSFGGPEVLEIHEVPAPQAGPGQVRLRVTVAGLNPMDWFMTADADTAVRFGLSLPAGLGTDYAGVAAQVGDGVTGFAPGDRVFGGALSRAVADEGRLRRREIDAFRERHGSRAAKSSTRAPAGS